jgi:hypothetical protein
MQGVLKRATATLLLLAILVVPTALADEPPAGTEPPSARIAPPIGATASCEGSTLAQRVWAWLRARIAPPIG